MKSFEILAPVGGSEQLIAAVRSGADAVYLGTKGFNARRNAENFEAETSLKDAVTYCHARGVRVNVTLNTLVTDRELDNVEKAVFDIADAGADAIIIQDLAVAELVRKCCPDIAMHASTQMAVHNAEGVRALKKLGFQRVVLARELTLEEIRAVAASTDLEIETFIHGALCMSASGLCELSAMIGGRSGNRGLCAQPCRLNFTCRDRKYALSLKDMSFVRSLPQLVDAGVCSLKIEGRMKRPEYVAAAVTACRAAAAGEPVDMDTLQAVFSRSGFTDGYLTGKRDLGMFGYRTKEDVQSGQNVLKSLAGLYRAERQSIPVDMKLTLKADTPAILTASDGEICVSSEGPIPQKAHSAGITPETAGRNLGKTGGTQFFLMNLDTDIDNGYTLSAAEMNAMRRSVIEQLQKLRETPCPKTFVPYVKKPAQPHKAPEQRTLRMRFENREQIFDDPYAELIILPLAEIYKDKSLIDRFGSRLAAEIPALCYPMQEKQLKKKLADLRSAGLSHVTAETIGAVTLGAELGYTVHGGASLNILNSRALEEYASLGVNDAVVSIETAMGSLRHFTGSVPRGIISYGYLPLMKFRACPAQGPNGCAGCSGLTTVKDRIGEQFTVICRGKQYSELLNCVPLYIGDKNMIGADFCLLYFTTESQSQCRHAAELFVSGAPADFRRTNGLYFRELL